jgi:hypothetical protein
MQKETKMIWISDHPKHCWAPGTILETTEGDTYEAEDFDGEVFLIPKSEAVAVHPNSLSTYPLVLNNRD